MLITGSVILGAALRTLGPGRRSPKKTSETKLRMGAGEWVKRVKSHR